MRGVCPENIDQRPVRQHLHVSLIQTCVQPRSTFSFFVCNTLSSDIQHPGKLTALTSRLRDSELKPSG